MRLDTAEDIQKCLSCEKPRCNNCLRSSRPIKKIGRPAMAVARSTGDKIEWFESAKEAAKAMGCSDFPIRQAIRKGKMFCGYWWCYER